MLELTKKYKSGSAVEIIRDAILSGEISGEIGQREVADSLGVSRIPVRDALITLEYHGLIEKLPNQHVRITLLDDRAIRDLFSDMAMLEIGTVKSLPPEKLQHLSSLSQSEFHRELYENTHSQLRKNFLRIITETYITFVIEHSDGAKVSAVFEDLKHALDDMSILRAGYTVYAEVLASELIRILNDNRRNNHA